MSAELRIPITLKQQRFIDLEDIDSVLLGGQAGGGKSEGLLAFSLMRRVKYPGSYGLLLRRTFPELEKSLIRKSFHFFSKVAKYNESKKQWVFPGGSIQEFGYCANENDVYQYQSAEYDDICIDEASHFTEFQLKYMQSRLRPRSAPKGLMRFSSNPGNVGHNFLKESFVDVARNRIYTDSQGKTRYFLPATLDDNTLMSEEERGNYRSWLAGLSERERKQLSDGDWDYVPGAVFSELDRQTHGIDPDKPPDWVTECFDFNTFLPKPGIHVFRFGDWGYARPFAYYWAFSTYDGRIVIFKEMYGCKTDEPNTGLKMITRDQAKRIYEYEHESKIVPSLVVCDASIWDRPQSQNERNEKLPSDAEIMAQEGVYWDRDISIAAKRSRKQGVQQMHDRLRMDGDGKAGLYVFLSCHHWWRTVPVLQPDKLDPDLYDSDLEDHSADATRYLCSARPYKSHAPKPESKPWTWAWYENRMEMKVNDRR